MEYGFTGMQPATSSVSPKKV